MARFRCPLCGLVAPRLVQLDHHLITKHAKELNVDIRIPKMRNQRYKLSRPEEICFLSEKV
jgi:hypothetical protein